MTQLELFGAAPPAHPPPPEKPATLAADPAPKPKEPIDQALEDLRLDINRFLAMGHNYVSDAAVDLLVEVRLGSVVFSKKALPYALVQELRRGKLATFTCSGKAVRVRLDEQRIIEAGNQAAERTERFAS